MKDYSQMTNSVVSDVSGRLGLQSPASERDRGNFKVVLVFDTAASRYRGLDISHQIQAGLKGENDLSCNLWSVDLLKSRHFAAVAAQQATEADLVILSCEGHTDLPERVFRWLSLWAASPRGRRAHLMLAVGAANLTAPCWAGIVRRVSDMLVAGNCELHTISHEGPARDYYHEYLHVMNRSQRALDDGLDGVVHRFEKPKTLAL